MTAPVMKLVRVAHTEMATYGVLIDTIPFAVTLERPWKGNQRMVSCIPHGVYTCYRVQSPKFGYTFEVQDVPGRSHILFHKGNLEDDTHGCILLGESFNPVMGKYGIVRSGEAFSEFLKINSLRDSFTLEIVEV